jgi:hypothetical protein
MAICLALHLLMIIKVGGVPLLLSIVDVKYRSSDSPAAWGKQLKNWLHL